MSTPHGSAAKRRARPSWRRLRKWLPNHLEGHAQHQVRICSGGEEDVETPLGNGEYLSGGVLAFDRP